MAWEAYDDGQEAWEVLAATLVFGPGERFPIDVLADPLVLQHALLDGPDVAGPAQAWIRGWERRCHGVGIPVIPSPEVRARFLPAQPHPGDTP